jgi:DNA-binding MarR family transcriptional regulator
MLKKIKEVLSRKAPYPSSDMFDTPAYAPIKQRGRSRPKQQTNDHISQTVQEAVLSVLKKNQNKHITYQTIGSAIGYTGTTVGIAINDLKRKGNIIVSGKKLKTYKVVNETIGKRGTRKPLVKTVASKSSVKDEPTLEITAAQRRVLSFIRGHQHQTYTLDQIGRATGVSPSYVSKTVAELQLAGIVQKSGATADGIKYMIMSDKRVTERPKLKSVDPEHCVETGNEGQLVGVIDSLVWDYVRETRSTNILGFLTWLEDRK